MTGLTEEEFQALLPYFEQAFVSYMQDRTIDGQPRTSRRYSTYETCPVPTMADQRLFILTYLKQHLLQDMQGQLLGMSQSHANTWLHLLHPVLNQTVADQELLPARTAKDCAAMFTTNQTDRPATAPLFFMMERNVPSSDPKILRNSKSMTAARRKATRSKTSS
jgi:hypothetical protein